MIDASKYYALAITCGAKRGPKDSDLTFSPASLRDFLEALAQPEQDTIQRLSALVRAQQITIDKLEAQLDIEGKKDEAL